MEAINAAILNKKFGTIISPSGEIRVPWGWHYIIDRMLQRLHDLPTEIRAYLIVVAIVVDGDGLLSVQIAAAGEYIPPGGVEAVAAIVKDARDHAAWSCMHEGKVGWLVRSPAGPKVLCQDCQAERGLEVQRHEA